MIDPFKRPKTGPITFDAGGTVLLCEGFDECAVLRKLCADWAPAPKIGVCQEGLDYADEIKDLATQVKMHQVAAIGLVFDAEGNRARRVDEIKKWLTKAGFKPPQGPLRLRKSSLGDALVQVAYLVNPHGKERGAIESYFLPQICRTKHWCCIDELLRCYEEREPSKVLREKLIVRTFIAHRNGRNTGLNAAFNAGILDCSDASLNPVRRFVALLREAQLESPKAASPSRTR